MARLLSDLGEKLLIREVIRNSGPLDDLLLPLNDDAQILRPPSSLDHPQVIATDRTPTDLRPLVWGIYSYQQYGAYHAISNLSDIAAMGAKPFGYLLNIAAPGSFLLSDFKSVFQGVSTELAKYDTILLGGDTKQGSELNLVGIAIGQSWREKVLTRSGCRPGDKLIISGRDFGYIPAAHALFSRSGWCPTNLYERQLTDAFYCLRPHFAETKLLQDSGVCTSCIDNSDGIAASLDEISEASGVSFRLYPDSLVIADAVSYVASSVKQNPLELLLGAGGDFRIIATVREFPECLHSSFIVIGEAQEIHFQPSSSAEFDLSRVSRWNHFTV
jgi:thiamine-monophosphate kinase